MGNTVQSKVTPQERINLFNQLTRQNLQQLGSKAGTEGGIVSFDLPKVRLLGKLYVRINAVLTASHATQTIYAPHPDGPLKFVKKAELSLNNGFSPFSLSGQSILPYMHSIDGVPPFTVQTSGRYPLVQPVVCSVGGTANAVSMFFEIPAMVNARDPIGLVLLQNDETLATVNITLGTAADLAPALAGYTFTTSGISVSLLSETYTIPAIPDAFPDISTLHMMQEKTETIVAGENIIKFPVSQIYRKLGFMLYDSTGARLTGPDNTIITSTIDIMFNQAEIPYKIFPSDLAFINTKNYNAPMLPGTFIFDWGTVGAMLNLSGARDYIDSSRLSELWIRFTAASAGSAKFFYETLSILK